MSKYQFIEWLFGEFIENDLNITAPHIIVNKQKSNTEFKKKYIAIFQNLQYFWDKKNDLKLTRRLIKMRNL